MDPYVQTDNEAIRDKTVDALMVSDRREWDVDLIKDIFTERDAQLILSLPLSSTDADGWFWKWNMLGQYTIKSAYDAIREAKQDANVDDRIQWKRVWNLNIPLKVKHFIWRAMKNVLLTKDQLLSKRVAVLDKCPVCNMEMETVYHTLVSCHFGK